LERKIVIVGSTTNQHPHQTRGESERRAELRKKKNTDYRQCRARFRYRSSCFLSILFLFFILYFFLRRSSRESCDCCCSCYVFYFTDASTQQKDKDSKKKKKGVSFETKKVSIGNLPPPSGGTSEKRSPRFTLPEDGISNGPPKLSNVADFIHPITTTFTPATILSSANSPQTKS